VICTNPAPNILHHFTFNMRTVATKTRLENFKMRKMPLKINNIFLILKFAILILVATILTLKAKWCRRIRYQALINWSVERETLENLRDERPHKHQREDIILKLAK